MAAMLAAATRATARGAAAREAATARQLPKAAVAAAAAAVPTRAVEAVPTRAAPTAAVMASAAPLTFSINVSSGVGSVGARPQRGTALVRSDSAQCCGPQRGPCGTSSAESDGFVPRQLIVRACSFERKVGQQRRGDASGMLQRSVSFGRKTPRSSGSSEGGQTGPLQLVPSVRHGPCYTPYRATFP